MYCYWRSVRDCDFTHTNLVYLYFISDDGVAADCLLHFSFLDEYETLHQGGEEKSTECLEAGTATLKCTLSSLPSPGYTTAFFTLTSFTKSSSRRSSRNIVAPSLK